ncbi:MRP3-like protein [Mya arenaria]|uniref:MRP3-like protein n=1 Tax=Mya arenaria TaxID=6604 RepID=A0ABY7E8K8_MYAAR|nr:MRP3-like protein [Mya arenaria]
MKPEGFSNKFSRDVETIDNALAMNFRMFLTTFFSALSTVVVISYTTPTFLAVLVPVMLLYYMVQIFSRCRNNRLHPPYDHAELSQPILHSRLNYGRGHIHCSIYISHYCPAVGCLLHYTSKN